MNAKVEKKTFDDIDAKMKEIYFASKVDKKMIPVTIKTVSACLDGKTETIVSRILEVEGKPLVGIDYADKGKAINAWTVDEKGHRENIETKDERACVRDGNEVIDKISSNILKRIQNAKTVDETKEKNTQRRSSRTVQVTREREF